MASPTSINGPQIPTHNHTSGLAPTMGSTAADPAAPSAPFTTRQSLESSVNPEQGLPSALSGRKRGSISRKVSFGPPLSPQLFDKTQPANTSLRHEVTEIEGCDFEGIANKNEANLGEYGNDCAAVDDLVEQQNAKLARLEAAKADPASSGDNLKNPSDPILECEQHEALPVNPETSTGAGGSTGDRGGRDTPAQPPAIPHDFNCFGRKRGVRGSPKMEVWGGGMDDVYGDDSERPEILTTVDVHEDQIQQKKAAKYMEGPGEENGVVEEISLKDQPKKRGRGRPRKGTTAVETAGSRIEAPFMVNSNTFEDGDESKDEDNAEPVTKKKGGKRPRRKQLNRVVTIGEEGEKNGDVKNSAGDGGGCGRGEGGKWFY
ncbi:hypothetical protein HK102_000235 [Quaeritorhiza haematococci]|nr:hypothetical protein HK102_000235 [Quaeritorhiza haematococci]